MGGGNTYLRNVAPALRERGHRCLLISATGETRSQILAAFDRVVERPLIYPWNSAWLARFLREERVDVVNAQSVVQMSTVLRTLRKVPIGLVLTFAAPFPAKRVQRFLGAADSVMVMNQYQKRHFVAMGAPADRTWQSYWMMDWAAYEKLAKPWADRKYDAVYCSRLSGTKGPLAVAFLDGLRALLPERPDLRAAVVGEGRLMPQVREAVDRFNSAAGRNAAEIVTGVLDTAPIFADARVVSGGNYVSIEGIAAGAAAIGAGYDGVFGVVDPDNLEDAAEQYFGDHCTPITGVERQEERLVGDYRDAFRGCLMNGEPEWLRSLRSQARHLFCREEAVDIVEREFAKAARHEA